MTMSDLIHKLKQLPQDKPIIDGWKNDEGERDFNYDEITGAAINRFGDVVISFKGNVNRMPIQLSRYASWMGGFPYEGFKDEKAG